MIVFHGILAILLAGFLTTLPTIASAYLGTPTQDPYANGDGDPDEPYASNPTPAKYVNIQNDTGDDSPWRGEVRVKLADSDLQPPHMMGAGVSFSVRLQMWLLAWMFR
ncbi:MAG: hypothetical protein KJ927_03120 [Candidatus Eisenbacteria bacterium]|nr:hypothetical protein [Candidatus Eisenbacteria bacterium]